MVMIYYFLMFFVFYFIINFVLVFEKDACPSGPLMRIGQVKTRRKVGETDVSKVFFLLYPPGSEG